MDKTFIQAFLDEFDDSSYPEGFTKNYEALERIAHSPAEETLLVKNRESGGLFIAKCCMIKDGHCDAIEAKILKRLNHDSLPKFIAEYKNDNILCVVREYAGGTPLDRYAAENKLSREEILCIGQQLCDALTYLHNETPPIIHRDIKPQNIIIDENKKVKLIDFGISRIYDKKAEKDTIALGTKYFAAPEQYGFSQTDCRADIFSLGVLLGWLSTGEVKLENILEKAHDRRLKHIIRKCTAFSPANRYSSAKKVKRALRGNCGLKRLLRLAVCLLAGAVFLFAGFAAGRYTDWFQGTPQSVAFSEPLIEQAVRLSLDMPEGQPIMEKDLLSVTEIYIYGDKAAGGRSTFEQLGTHMAANDGYLRNGGIVSLNDLAMMKNLRSVNIALQDISDLSPLSSLPVLAQVDLKHNPIKDLSPLSELQTLQEICLYDTQVSDLSALKHCSQLYSIEAGKTQISSISGFGGIAALKRLGLVDVPLKTLDGIEEYNHLEQISLSHIADNDLQPLLALPQLHEAYLSESLSKQAKNDLVQAQFTISLLSQ